MFGFIFLWLALILVFAFIAQGFFKRYPQYSTERRSTFITLGIVWIIGVIFIVYQNRGSF